MATRTDGASTAYRRPRSQPRHRVGTTRSPPILRAARSEAATTVSLLDGRPRKLVRLWRAMDQWTRATARWADERERDARPALRRARRSGGQDHGAAPA